MKKLRYILTTLFVFSIAMFFACSGCGEKKSSSTIDVIDKEITMYVGEDYLFEPNYTGEKKLSYSVTDKNALEVTENGKVTAKAEGVYFITIGDGEISVTCKIIILRSKDYIELSSYSAAVVEGGSKEITAIVYEDGRVVDKTVEFMVEPSVSEFSVNGNKITIMCDKVGYYTISAKSGSLTSKCEIKAVNKNAQFLSSPTISVENCETVKWSLIENADAYQIMVNGEEWKEITDNEYSVGSYTDTLKVDEKLIIAVRAIARNSFDYIDGNPTRIKFEHTFDSEVITPFSCAVAGTIKYTCKVCARSYLVENYKEPHKNKDGACIVCGEVMTKGVLYLYDEERECYFVAGADAGFDSKNVYFLSEYDDGKNGKHPVKYVGINAFIYNNFIERVFLPESITELHGLCFAHCPSLKFVSMPGITYLPAIDESDYKHDNFRDCYELKAVIVGNDFYNKGRNFFAWQNRPENYTPSVDVYILGNSVQALATDYYPISDFSRNNYLLTGKTYFYNQARSRCETWYYDTDNETPIINGTHNYVNEVCEICGDIKTYGIVYAYDEAADCYYVKGTERSFDGELVNILSEYDDGTNGKHPVNYVGMNAFRDNAKLKAIYLPETITELRGECFWACSNLEFVSMPGITYLPAKNETDYKHNNFANCYNLKNVIVGNNFDNVGRNFFAGNNTPEGYKGQVDILIKGTSVKKIETTSYPIDVSLNYNSPIWNITNNALLSGKIFFYNSGNAKTCMDVWYYDENGKVVKQEKTTDHVYTDGVCVCGKYQTEGIEYVFDTDHYYVAEYKGAATEVHVLKEYDDGTNGKHPVSYVGMNAFKDNTRIKEVYLPETITELKGECFWACSNLEFISMPGITYLPAKNETDYKHNNFANCYNLKTVIVGNDFDNSGRNFFAGNNTPEGYKGQVDILVKGMSVKKLETTSYPIDVTLNYNESKWNDANNALLSGRVFYYNENKATCINAWYYEENGKAVKQEKTTDHEYDGGVCACGKYQTEGLVYVFDTDHYYVNKYTGSATEVYVAKEYDDGINGKHPVTTIKKEAFQKKTIIIKVVLPESVENVEGEAFFECTALETLIMPGVKVFNEGNGAFNLTHNCIALRTIVLNGEADIGRKVFNSDKDEGKGVANVYLTSANKLKFRDAQGNYVEDYFKNQNNILSGKFYEYSDTQKSDCWHYVNGIPSLWE